MTRSYHDVTYDMFLSSLTDEAAESTRFFEWVREVEADGAFAFEARHQGSQTPEVDLVRTDGQAMRTLNLASYNYLGLGYHPEVIEAAKRALDRHGLGAGSSPVHSGTFEVHRDLEQALLDFYALPDRAVSVFSSGYAVNVGSISALMKRPHHIVMDRSVHMSILEGAQLARSNLHYFEHNDAADLERVLAGLSDRRTLVCTEGLYSADGDFGALRDIAAVAKAHDAWILVDEAHSVGVAGATGRGVAEAAGVLADIDLLVVTFSKAFGGVGGAVITRPELARYISWYAKCRMFSCALDPAVTAGVAEAVRLAKGPEGQARRHRLLRGAARLREQLAGRVDLGRSESWIVTVVFGEETLTIPLLDYLQKRGLDVSLLQFPAVPMGEARIRMFVTSEHDDAQLDHAAALIVDAAETFGFGLARP